MRNTPYVTSVIVGRAVAKSFLEGFAFFVFLSDFAFSAFLADFAFFALVFLVRIVGGWVSLSTT